MLCDFHSHTFLSDGCLSPLELIRRASVAGYRALALTDHVGPGSLSRVIGEIQRDCALARKHWDILALPGVELTHLPPAAIPEAAREARQLGAAVVVVHGETLVEPVAEGTNLAAAQCPFVDILAHPGTLSEEEAEAARRNGVFIEITTRKGHRKGNAQVAAAAMRAGAMMLVNSDSHVPEDLLTADLVNSEARAAGIADALVRQTLEFHPTTLIQRAGMNLR